MLLDWLHGDLYHWTIFCCVVASLGLVGAFIAATAATTGKGVFAFLNGSRTPTVIVVNAGGQYIQQPAKKRWSFGRYWLLFAAIFSGGPMLTLLIMGVTDLFWTVVGWIGANLWVLAIATVGAALVAAFAWLIRSDRLRDRQTHAQIAALPETVAAPIVTAQPVVGWSMPSDVGQWDQR